MTPIPSPTTAIDKKADKHCTIVVLGASGDLAYKKTYPALFGLFKNSLLPQVKIVGYARSEMDIDKFRKRITTKIKVNSESDREKLDMFLDLNSYVQGRFANRIL